MKNRIHRLTALLLVAGLVLLAGCADRNAREAAAVAAPVPPPPGDAADTHQNTPAQTNKQPDDLPDRLFAPLDDAVNIINRDTNREIDKEFPENRDSQNWDPGD